MFRIHQDTDILLLFIHSTYSSTLLPCPATPGQLPPSANESEAKRSSDSNLDIVQLTNNLNTLVRAVISIAALSAFNMFIYIIHSIRYFYDRTDNIGNTFFDFIFLIFCCNQTNEIGANR